MLAEIARETEIAKLRSDLVNLTNTVADMKKKCLSQTDQITLLKSLQNPVHAKHLFDYNVAVGEVPSHFVH